MPTLLVLADVVPTDGPYASLGARLCAAISRLDPPPPLVVVAHGSLAALLPSVALAQRSAHRRVAGYVLVDPVLPVVSDGWPDAPVTVVTDDDTSPASMQGRLRGWEVLTSAQYAQRGSPNEHWDLPD